MKKTILLFILFSLMVLTAFSWAEEKAKQEVVIKKGEPYYLAIMESSGSYEQIPDKINTFMAEFFKQKLTPGGPLHGVYYNSPQQVKEDELKWAIGFPVPKDADVQDPLKKVEVNHPMIAVYLYTGPYEEMEPAYAKILEYIDSKGYKMVLPAYDKYLNNPYEVKPEELQTEIVIPLEKK